jgi:hypothetical protein
MFFEAEQEDTVTWSVVPGLLKTDHVICVSPVGNFRHPGFMNVMNY